ncbi:MAG: hypothetical protein ACOC1K_04955 [Nanoarchaeota archaeon]
MSEKNKKNELLDEYENLISEYLDQDNFLIADPNIYKENFSEKNRELKTLEELIKLADSFKEEDAEEYKYDYEKIKKVSLLEPISIANKINKLDFIEAKVNIENLMKVFVESEIKNRDIKKSELLDWVHFFFGQEKEKFQIETIIKYIRENIREKLNQSLKELLLEAKLYEEQQDNEFYNNQTLKNNTKQKINNEKITEYIFKDSINNIGERLNARAQGGSTKAINTQCHDFLWLLEEYDAFLELIKKNKRKYTAKSFLPKNSNERKLEKFYMENKYKKPTHIACEFLIKKYNLKLEPDSLYREIKKHKKSSN